MKNGNIPRKHGRISRTSNNSQDTFEEIRFKTSRTSDMCSSVMKTIFRTKRKKILKGLSVYFNPGEMIGIMGPSGKFLQTAKTFTQNHTKIKVLFSHLNIQVVERPRFLTF